MPREIGFAEPTPDKFCSFCGKSYRRVGPLVEGPAGLYICGECADLCQWVIEQEIRRRGNESESSAADPHAVRAALDRCLADQEPAKAALVQAAMAREEGRARILLVGAAQSAAIMMAHAVAHALDFPFVAGDASALDKPEKENLLVQLLELADFDLDAFRRGVLFVGGLERPEAQQAVARLWAEGAGRPVPGLELDVRGVLFVCGGSFAGLDEARHPELDVTVDALEAVGAHAEWARALAAIARVAPIDEASLTRIVQSVDFDRLSKSS